MKNFYIFLDIDGVFNCYQWLIKTGQLTSENFYTDLHWEICSANVKVFNRILKTLRENNFKPKIVISSAWRYGRMQKAIDLFNKYGIDYQDNYDKTGLNIVMPGEERSARGYEISSYLKNHNIKNNYVVIDDEVSELHPFYIKPNHILQTSGLHNLGLSPKNADRFKKEILPIIISETYESPFEMEK